MITRRTEHTGARFEASASPWFQLSAILLWHMPTMTPDQFQLAFFWLSIALAMMSMIVIWVVVRYKALHQRRKELTWDIHSEYIDISEFSNRNIPLKVTYKGIEPRWLWATYLSLRNSGTEDVSSEDTPDKQSFIIGAQNCRYIGFNKLISDKARVVLSPLFQGNDVYCKLDFDRLGPGDEILVSLLYIADEKQRVELEGALYGAHSQVVNGYYTRMANWRGVWWLVIGALFFGAMAALAVYTYSPNRENVLMSQLWVLSLVYFMTLATAAVLLRPIYNWQQMLERFGEPGYRRSRSLKQLRYLFFIDREL